MTREAIAKFGEAVRQVLLAEEKGKIDDALPHLRWMWKIDVIDNPDGSTSVMPKRILVTHGRDVWQTYHLPRLAMSALIADSSHTMVRHLMSSTEPHISLTSLLLGTETPGSYPMLTAASGSLSDDSIPWITKSLEHVDSLRIPPAIPGEYERFEFEFSPLAFAARLGRADTLAFLLDNFPQDNGIANRLLSCISTYPAYSDRGSVVELLLGLGADPNAKFITYVFVVPGDLPTEHVESTKLIQMCASSRASPNAVSALLMGGANVYQRNSLGQTPFSVVRNPEIRALLEAAVASPLTNFIRHTRSARRLFYGGNLIIDIARLWYVPTLANVAIVAVDSVQIATFCALPTSFSLTMVYLVIGSHATYTYPIISYTYPIISYAYSVFAHMLSGYALNTLNPLIPIQAIVLHVVALGTIVSAVSSGLIFIQKAATFAHEFTTCEFDRNSHEAWSNVCTQLSRIVTLDILDKCVKHHSDMASSLVCKPDIATGELPKNFVYTDLSEDVTCNITLAGAT